MSKPYRFELADSIGHILVNGLPLRLIRPPRPMSKTDSVYYQEIVNILKTVTLDWAKLEASGLSPRRAAERLAVDLKRRSTVIENVKVAPGPILQIFWKGRPYPETVYAPVQARTSRPDPVVKPDPAEPARRISETSSGAARSFSTMRSRSFQEVWMSRLNWIRCDVA